MKVNFDIKNNHILVINGFELDLHNNFDFIGLEYKVIEKEIKIKFEKTKGDWVDKNEFSSLIFTHFGVSYFQIDSKDENSNLEDDICLSEFTYFPSTLRQMNDSIIPQLQPNDGDDFLYFFENGQLIRINCTEIILNLELSNESSENNFTNKK